MMNKKALKIGCHVLFLCGCQIVVFLISYDKFYSNTMYHSANNLKWPSIFESNINNSVKECQVIWIISSGGPLIYS